MAPRFNAPRFTNPRFAAPRYATLCAVAALAVGLAGCAATSQPARNAERTVATTKAPEERNSGEALAKIARKSLENGDPVSAVSMLKRAHEMSPDSAPILAELGRTLAALKAWRESSDAYAKAADLAPKDPAIRRGHAGALLALDLPTLAEQEYRAALALHEDAQTLSGLGVTLDLQNRHEEALAAFRRALDLDPNGTATRTNLGLSLALWGASNEAIGLLAPMAASSTSDARQRQNLALAFGLSGDIDQARAVAKMDLNDEAVRNNLAYYETLRGLAPNLRMRSLMGQPPTLATTGAAAVVSENTGDATPRPVDATPPSAVPEKPSRAAENAPEPKVKAKPVATATPSKVDSRIPTSAVAETAPTKAPRVKAANAASAKSVEPKSEIASKVSEPNPATESALAPSDGQPAVAIGAPVETPATPNDTPSVSAAPEAATTEPVAATESSKHAYDDLAADVRAAAKAESQTSTATLVEEKPSAHNASVDEPVAPKPANDNAPTARADEHSSATEPAANETAASAEPKVEATETPAASAAAASDTAVTDASSGSATASAPASEQEARAPTDALPRVSVRVGGVPLANVPQTQVTLPLPAAAVETKDTDAQPAVASKPVDATVAVESKPVADGDAVDLPPPPTTEPIKRDGPTRLLPQSHAAIDPLY